MALENVNVFLVHSPTRNLDDYRAIAEHACKLKPYGEVQMNVSTLAGRGHHDVPAGGSPWHHYACNNPCPQKFFPHEKLKPFIPAKFVEKNRQLLLAKAAILRELDLKAAFWSYEPNFLPEEFFEAYPHMRGPRVDHPRRSRQEAFAPCLSQSDTQEMIASQVAELIRNVPEIRTFFFKTNDAGPGICWSYWQYSGPNGPAHCRGLSMGQRVRLLLDSLNRGAEMGGGEFRIQFTGNFSGDENESIEQNLPDNAFYRRPRMNRAATAAIRGSVDSCYPIRGIVNPLAVLRDMQGLADGQPRTIFVSFRPSYDRGYETPEASGKVFDMAADCLKEPVTGIIPTLQRLERWCEQWGGEKESQKLFDAMYELQEAFKALRGAGISAARWGVSLRHITRPLVVVPSNLTEEEESYWLPHVFNISVEEARQDYVDTHGGRRSVQPRMIEGVRRRLLRIADTLESLDSAPEKVVFRKMAISLRMYCCFIRSGANFYSAQLIRDRNVEKLSQMAPAPPKLANWSGDPDLIPFNEVMRDEFDNAQELIDLLEGGGMDLLCHATDAGEEDIFLLGPDIVDQLKKKRKIMRRHWLDIQNHFMTPLK